MSAPVIWIFIPIIVGSASLLISRERVAAIVGGGTALILTGAALIVPIDEALGFGSFSLKVASSFQILGRNLTLESSEMPLLAILFGAAAVWFIGAESAGVARRLTPFGLIITGLLVGSIAVQPFLYAALLIELSVLAAVPLLLPSDQIPSRGVIRFLIYQTLGMPFILIAGWLSTGVEASPGDLALTVQSATMLGVGFAFLLAIFPTYSWIPLLMEDSSPYVVGFLLWLLPTATSILGMSFLDRYEWLRTSVQVIAALRVAGLVMVVSGGIWTAFQHHMGRLMAFAAVTETGFILLSLSLDSVTGLPIVFLLLIPRGLALAVWALSLSIIDSKKKSLRFPAVHGMARTYPLAAAGMILSALSMAGFPLLAGFPPRLALWSNLAQQSLSAGFWLLIGFLGLATGAIRMLAVLVTADEKTAWASEESWAQRGMLGIGIIGFLIFGLFPQIANPILDKLPLMFQHLGH
ncbi:MAG TPA: proton-conducting transporter membrane subunit [Anaerolineales bacterium]|nr:proton-conducting transporter membrane subunit [Anaerolineales bacterium]